MTNKSHNWTKTSNGNDGRGRNSKRGEGELALANGVTTAERREYTEAVLGLQMYNHHLYKSMRRNPHEAERASV